MNKAEAAQVLAVIAAPYPWDVTDDMAEVWFRSVLAGVDLETGLGVAMQLVETSERMPVPASFKRTLTAMRVAESRQVLERPALSARSVSQRDQAEIRQIIAETKAKLASLASEGPRGHWHGGPDVCPVCGGINPRVLQRMPDGQLR